MEYREIKYFPLPAWGCGDNNNGVIDDVTIPDKELNRGDDDVIVISNVVCVTDWSVEAIVDAMTSLIPLTRKTSSSSSSSMTMKTFLPHHKIWLQQN